MRTIRWLPLVMLLVVPWLPSDSRAQGGGAAPAGPPCSCKQQDKIDLQNRIDKLQEADKEYDRLIKQWQQQEATAKKPTTLNESLRKQAQDSVVFRMEQVGNPNATPIKGSAAKTNNMCETWINPQVPPCLRSIIDDHEAKHRVECRAQEKKKPGFWETVSKSSSIVDFLDRFEQQMDWRYSQSIVDYLKEEKADHQAEIAQLQAELTKMKNLCKQFTELDPSEREFREQALAQRERMDQAERRLDVYAKSLS